MLSGTNSSCAGSRLPGGSGAGSGTTVLLFSCQPLGLGAFLGLLTRAHTKLTSDSLGDPDTPPSPVLSLYLLIPPSPTSIPGVFTLPQEPEKVAYIH